MERDGGVLQTHLSLIAQVVITWGGKRALMGILCSRQAWARAPSSSAAINKGKYASLDQDRGGYLQSSQLTVASGVKCTCSTFGLSPGGPDSLKHWFSCCHTTFIFNIFLILGWISAKIISSSILEPTEVKKKNYKNISLLSAKEHTKIMTDVQ